MEDFSETVQETAKASFSLTLSNIISNVSLAIATLVIGALLGASSYGLYSLAIATPTFLTSVVDFGLAFSLLNFCSKLSSKGSKDDSFSYLFNASFITLAVAILATFTSIFFSSYIASNIINRPEASNLVALASISILFGAIVNLLTYFFVGVGESRRAAISQATLGIVKGIAQIILVVLGLSALGAILGHVLGTMFAAVVSILALFKLNSKVSVKLNLSKLKEMLSYGFPIYISTFITSFVSQYQAYLIGNFSTNFSAGNYKMALNFLILVSMVATPITIALVPAFSKVNSEKYASVYEALTKYTSLVILPVSIAVIIFSREGVELLLGEGYSQASFFLSLMTLIYLLVPIGSLTVYSFINGIGKTKISLILNMLNAFLFILLARAFMISYGITGMIVASLFASLISLIVAIVYLKAKYNVIFNSFWALKIYFASSISVAVTILLLWFINLSGNLVRLVVGGSIFFASFLTLIPLFGILSSKDLELFKKLTSDRRFLLVLMLILKYEERLVNIQEKIRHRLLCLNS
ncbi:MAG: oligosaccharide flippase family protein [Thermoproteota archaeon]